MPKGTVVDTCALFKCFNDLLLDDSSDGALFLSAVFDRGFLAIDSEGRAMQEYEDTAKPGALREGLTTWIADQALHGRVLAFEIDHSQNKAIRELGLPKKDWKWIGIAIGSGSKIIVTEDIDLFDPTEKGCGAKRREAIMSGSSGKLAHFCKKKLGVLVTICANYDDAVAKVD